MVDKRTVKYPQDAKKNISDNIRDYGYKVYKGKKGYNGNLPGLYCTKDHNVFSFDYCFHMWDFMGVFDIAELDLIEC